MCTSPVHYSYRACGFPARPLWLNHTHPLRSVDLFAQRLLTKKFPGTRMMMGLPKAGWFASFSDCCTKNVPEFNLLSQKGFYFERKQVP